MAKKIPDAVIDKGLEDIAKNGTRLYLCSAEPSLYSSLASFGLGFASLTTGISGGDFTVADGDSSGRKLTVAQKIVTASKTDTCNHVAIADSVNELLKAVTTVTGFSTASGEDVTIKAFDVWEIRDPA